MYFHKSMHFSSLLLWKVFLVVCSKMKFIVFSYEDDEIFCVPQEDVNLLDYSNFSLEDWSNLPLTSEARVRVVYDSEVYEACVLQVVPINDVDVNDTLQMLRSAWSSHKIKRLSSLLKFCPDRVRASVGRQKWLPLQVCLLYCHLLLHTHPSTAYHFFACFQFNTKIFLSQLFFTTFV